MLDIASRSIGFRNEAAALKSKLPGPVHASFIFVRALPTVLVAGSLKISQKHTKELEAKLEATEKALKEAENKTSAVEGLQARLDAAEEALKEAKARASTAEKNLSDKVKEVTSREAGIKKRLDELTTSFGSKSEFSSPYYFATFTCLFSYTYLCYPCSRKTWGKIHTDGRPGGRSFAGFLNYLGDELQVGAQWAGVRPPIL